MFNAVIFDLDGVLIDSLSVMEQAYHKACVEVFHHKIAAPFSEFKRHLGKDLKSIFKICNLPKAAFDIYVNASNLLIDKINIFPGIIPVLKCFHERNIDMAIATGKEGSRARMILKQLNLKKFFKAVIGGDEVKYSKPHPEGLNQLIHNLNFKKNHTLFVGDMPVDLIAGRCAQLKVAAVLWGASTYDALVSESPDFLIEKPNQLLDLVLANADAI